MSSAMHRTLLRALTRFGIIAGSLGMIALLLAPSVQGDDTFDRLALVLGAVEAPRAEAPGAAGVKRNEKSFATTEKGGRHEPLFVDADYRLPDDSGDGEGIPYGATNRGGFGLFDIETPFVPDVPAWYFGFQYKYDSYKYINGGKGRIKGNQMLFPISVVYNRDEWAYGLVIPFQNWEVTSANGNTRTADLSGLHDVELRATRRMWASEDGTQAANAHVSVSIPGGNYHVPYADFSGAGRPGAEIGPAGATRGSRFGIGGAYSRRIDANWMSHLNLAYVHDGRDRIGRLAYDGALDYRIGRNLALTGQLLGTYWMADSGPDGGVIDFLLGAVVFNDRWQASIGIPVSLQHEWGYGHDLGFVGGISTHWD